MLTTKPRGTNDILPGEVEKWQYIEKVIREVCQTYGYREIRTPIFEHTELFQRGVGETTDIVEKEMYTFKDRGDRSITLRPEGTAAVVRSYLENKLYAGTQPLKLYYIGPMFRYDRPQAGRYRQFHQFGVEVLGVHSPGIDAEVMAMAMEVYGRLGLKDLELHINSLGCPQCRPLLKERLQEFLQPHLEGFCQQCKGRYHRNPLRILDCKSEKCKQLSEGAPTTADCLCPSCAAFFDEVKRCLDLLGIDYVVDKNLVRGLDYYTHTAFEIMAKGIGAQSSVGGGGRYNGLVEACGGPEIPGIGYALGLERILLAMEQQGAEFPPAWRPDVFLVTACPEAEEEVYKLLADLRELGYSADKDYMGRSLKAQMKYAGKLNARRTVIIGENELKNGTITVKDMITGEQEEIKREKITVLLGGK
ncbi:histidine--tRNA ligase [Desulfofalx alkaliphila]|uniref:histidine--tRNA ligase n=1 Tax=Desulfofalx alkaliphila TaxID=105483 RepID=UPI0004E0E31F|nr:histidine--tRNA ligase [Desulfofalx alkaliphila]